MSSAVMNSKVSTMDSSVMSVNRNKLMKLAEGIKTKKKPNHKNKSLNFKKDPGYTNIEHLVFGTYRPRTSLSSPTAPVAVHNVPTKCPTTPPEPEVLPSPRAVHGSPGGILQSNASQEQVQVSSPKNGLGSFRIDALGLHRSSNQNGSIRPDLEVQFLDHGKGVLESLSDPDIRNAASEIPLRLEDHSGFADSPQKRGAVMNHLLDGPVHSPPVHLLTQGKYVTREFSADFSSPDTPEPAGEAAPEKRHRNIYKADCCMPNRSDDIQNQRTPKASPGTARASMKMPTKKEVPPPYWSFRGGKPPAAASSAPMRSVSLCAANRAAKAETRELPQPGGGPPPAQFQSTPDVQRRVQVPPQNGPESQRSLQVQSQGTANVQRSPQVQLQGVANVQRSPQVQSQGVATVQRAEPVAKKVSEIPVAKKNYVQRASKAQSIAVPSHQRVASARDRAILARQSARKSAACDGSDGINCAPLATSVQTMRKISVPASDPARPVVSTKVKIVVSSENGEPDNNGGPNRAKGGSRASLVASGTNLASAKARSASRNSLPGCRTNNPAKVERPRTASIPASSTSGNFSTRNRSASACSLAASHRLGSSSSLGGSQCSLYSNQARRSVASARIDTGIRHSFNGQIPARSSPARAAAVGGRTSLRAAPTGTGKPPVCPGIPVKLAQGPPRDRGPAKSQPKNGTRTQIGKGAPAKGKGQKVTPKANAESKKMAAGLKADEKRDAADQPVPVSCDENQDNCVSAPPPDDEALTEISEDVMQLHKFLIEAFQNSPLPKSNVTGEETGEIEQEVPQEVEPKWPHNNNLWNGLEEPKLEGLGDASAILNVGSPETSTSDCGMKSEEMVAEPVPRSIRRTISLPRTCFQHQWNGPLPVSGRRSLPSRSNPDVDWRSEPPSDAGRAAKEFSLSRPNDSRSQTSPDSGPDPEFPDVRDTEKVPLSGDALVVASTDDDRPLSAVEGPATNDGVVGALSCRDSGCILETPPPVSPSEKHKPSVPKCVRRIKAASSPVFTDSRVDAWVSESDLHRPWSQICSERDVERLVQASSCARGSGSMAAGIESIVQMNPSAGTAGNLSNTSPTSSQSNLFARFSSMRTPSVRPPGSPVEGVLQKFRKSFSARFYKKVKAESPPSPSSGSSKAARHASFSSYLDDGSCEADLTPTHNGSLNASSVSDVSIDSSDGETIFRLGPIIWRSSKERKEKSRKLKKVNSKGSDSGAVECADSQSNHNVKHEPLLDVSSSCHSTPTNTASHSRPSLFQQCNPLSPQVLRRRCQSTTLHPDRLKRPLSDQGTTIQSSLGLSNPRPTSRNGDMIPIVNGNPHPTKPSRNGSVASVVRSQSTDVSSLPSVTIIRRERRTPGLRWSRGRSNLRRSVSQPLEMEKMDGMGGLSHSPGGLSDQEDLGHDLSTASSEEGINFNCVNGDGGRHVRKNSRHQLECVEPVLYAEALWDHVTMDPEELAFKAGDLVEVLDVSDGEWWWGINGNRIGWLPASFVRPRVNQEDTVEECVANMGNGMMHRQNPRKMSVSLLSNDQVRTNVIKEIVFTERDFVRHLEDVCEGYLKQMRKRVDMFPEERVSTIFGNVEQIYAFQSAFVAKLEQCIDWDQPHLSQIGSCFTEHREGFEMYSEYCNNHPQAVGELQQLYAIPKYAHFFEACRLLQDMIDISLDGFLLTPVQKICKYPLQLAELLKYTKPDHPDYKCVAEALDTMRNVAHYINERKRRMECLEKLAAWQMTVEYWEGPDLLDHSSELIHSGEASKVTAAWSRDFTLFLFDHQLIICKKDLLKRNSYTYKGRIDTDTCELKDIPDGKDTHFGLTLKNAWKLFCKDRGKWIIFATRTAEEKQRWMKAFEDERWRVEEDRQQGFVVTDKARKSAIMAVQSRKKPKRPKDKENKNLGRRLTRPDAYVVSTKSGSLPSNVVLTTNKKKTSSGWFHFGSNKKTKR